MKETTNIIHVPTPEFKGDLGYTPEFQALYQNMLKWCFGANVGSFCPLIAGVQAQLQIFTS